MSAWKQFARFRIPVFGYLDLALSLIPGKGVRVNQIFFLVAKPTATQLDFPPLSCMPFTLPLYVDQIGGDSGLGEYKPATKPVPTGWAKFCVGSVPALVNVGSCWWLWQTPTLKTAWGKDFLGGVVLGAPTFELPSQFPVNMIIGDSYLAASKSPKQALEFFGFRREIPFQVAGTYWQGGSPPGVCSKLLGIVGRRICNTR